MSESLAFRATRLGARRIDAAAAAVFLVAAMTVGERRELLAAEPVAPFSAFAAVAPTPIAGRPDHGRIGRLVPHSRGIARVAAAPVADTQDGDQLAMLDPEVVPELSYDASVGAVGGSPTMDLATASNTGNGRGSGGIGGGGGGGGINAGTGGGGNGGSNAGGGNSGGTIPGIGGSIGGGNPSTITPSVPAVPEPATWLLFIVAFGMIGGVLRRDRRRARAHSGFRAATAEAR